MCYNNEQHFSSFFANMHYKQHSFNIPIFSFVYAPWKVFCQEFVYI